jgi:hypothetical protein
MIPLVKTSSVFTSRWKALLWAIPVIWLAYTVATSAPQSDDNSANVATANASDNSTGAQKIPATWN